MVKNIALVSIVAFLVGCATYNPNNDPAYISYMNYSRNLGELVTAGEMTRADALVLDQQAYNQYLANFEQRRAAQASAFQSMQQNQRARTNCRTTPDYLGGYRTVCN